VHLDFFANHFGSLAPQDIHTHRGFEIPEEQKWTRFSNHRSVNLSYAV